MFEPTGDVTLTHEKGWHMAVVLEYPNHSQVEHGGNYRFADQTRRMRHNNTLAEAREEPRTENSNEGGIERAPTLAGAVRRISNSLQWTIEQCTLPEDDGREIAQQLIKGKGKCMSDGSTKNGLGTAAAQFMGVKAKNNYDVRN